MAGCLTGVLSFLQCIGKKERTSAESVTALSLLAAASQSATWSEAKGRNSAKGPSARRVAQYRRNAASSWSSVGTSSADARIAPKTCNTNQTVSAFSGLPAHAGSRCGVTDAPSPREPLSTAVSGLINGQRACRQIMSQKCDLHGCCLFRLCCMWSQNSQRTAAGRRAGRCSNETKIMDAMRR